VKYVLAFFYVDGIIIVVIYSADDTYFEDLYDDAATVKDASVPMTRSAPSVPLALPTPLAPLIPPDDIERNEGRQSDDDTGKGKQKATDVLASSRQSKRHVAVASTSTPQE
jgi:hypothetical protein